MDQTERETGAMDHPEVVVIGRSCVDYVAVVEKLPQENRKGPLESRLVEGGGQGGTSSCCISKLGGRVVYVGKLGDDREGRFCMKRLEDFGVNTDLVETVNGGKTPVAYIFITRATGSRTIIYEPSTLPKLEIEAILEQMPRRAGAVLLDPEVTYLGTRLRSRLDAETKLVYDCERWRAGIVDMMAAADFFVPSSEFLDAEELGFGEAPLHEKMAALKTRLRGTLVVTKGEAGAFYIDGNTLYRVPAPGIRVRDTLGAGDNFHAAFALAVSRGSDLHRAVKFSVAVSALSCRAYGGRNGIPGSAEAEDVAGKLTAHAVCRY